MQISIYSMHKDILCLDEDMCFYNDSPTTMYLGRNARSQNYECALWQT